MKERRNLLTGVGLIGTFAMWTVLIRCVDVQAVGQNGTKIGFSAFNVWFHQLTGVHMTIYTITDWLGLVPILICLCFGVLGLVQLVKRRRLLLVDQDILLLGVYYLLFLPVFGNGTDTPDSVSLYAITGISTWIKIVFAALIGAAVLNGICGVIISNFDKPVRKRDRIVTGMVLSIECAAVFILTRQPYAGIICLAILVVKGLLIGKWKSGIRE